MYSHNNTTSSESIPNIHLSYMEYFIDEWPLMIRAAALKFIYLQSHQNQ